MAQSRTRDSGLCQETPFPPGPPDGPRSTLSKPHPPCVFIWKRGKYTSWDSSPWLLCCQWGDGVTSFERL